MKRDAAETDLQKMVSQLPERDFWWIFRLVSGATRQKYLALAKTGTSAPDHL